VSGRLVAEVRELIDERASIRAQETELRASRMGVPEVCCSEEEAVSYAQRFMALPARSRAPSGLVSMHHHLDMRQFLGVTPPARCVMGTHVDARFMTPALMIGEGEHDAKAYLPAILKWLCEEYLRGEHCPPEVMGRPHRITCGDFRLAAYLKERIHSGTEVEFVDEATVIVPGPLGSVPVPLSAILDARAADLDAIVRSAMRGEETRFETLPDGTPYDPHAAEETSRPSRTQPGAHRSTVGSQAHELPLPAQLYFCCGPECGLMACKADLKMCGRCRGGPRYCSRACQRAHWTEGGHRQHCVASA
jgi:hypothetical protein